MLMQGWPMPNKPTTIAVKRPRGRPPGSKSKKKPAATWQDSLTLNLGEELRLLERAMTGNLGQRDVEQYEVVDAQGLTVGTVTYTATTTLKPPFRASYWVVQKDGDGNVILEERW